MAHINLSRWAFKCNRWINNIIIMVYLLRHQVVYLLVHLLLCFGPLGFGYGPLFTGHYFSSNGIFFVIFFLKFINLFCTNINIINNALYIGNGRGYASLGLGVYGQLDCGLHEQLGCGLYEPLSGNMTSLGMFYFFYVICFLK